MTSGESTSGRETLSLVRVDVTDAYVTVELSDGRRLATPLAWYPTLQVASQEERDQVEVWPWGIHWPLLDEDLSLDGMLSGDKPQRMGFPTAGDVQGSHDETVDTATAHARAGLMNGRVDFPDLESHLDG